MRVLNDREKRAIRIGAIAIGLYLAVFFGFQFFRLIEKQRAEYPRLVREAQTLKLQLRPYEDKIEVIRKQMEDTRMDPARLKRETVVAETSAAIQDAATAGGLQLGAIHESPARPSSKELGSIQLEGGGPAPAVVSLLRRLQSLGYPVLIDSVQLTPETLRQGQVKFNLTIVILDFDSWKNGGAPHA